MHECKHEVDLAVMAERQKTMADNVEKMARAILGNGKEGLKTRTAVIEKSVFRQWWAIGLIAVATVGSAIKAVWG